MKKSHFIYILMSMLLLVSCEVQQGGEKSLVDYVDPNIGGIGQIGHGLTSTSPTVSMPYGMMRISPITTPGINDKYLADKIYGFPAGSLSLMPMRYCVKFQIYFQLFFFFLPLFCRRKASCDSLHRSLSCIAGTLFPRNFYVCLSGKAEGRAYAHHSPKFQVFASNISCFFHKVYISPSNLR